MAEHTIEYEDENGFELDRDGKSLVVYGKIEATFSFYFYPDADSFEWSDETIDCYDIEIMSVVDSDENEIEKELAESEMSAYRKHMKDLAKDYFKNYGVAEYAALEPEYEKE